MAGAGYKLFNTGDVLTAAQVNTYLQEQAVMRFANATARTTALSGVLAEGMMSYLDDTNSVEVYNGSAWVSVGSTGDITGVTAGTGISGGGTSGDVTITNSMATAIDAKGDLVVGTGADTFSRLAVGSNNQVLTADSTTATGLKWSSAGTTFSGCLAKLQTTTAIVPTTATFLTLTETFDVDGYHSDVTNPTRFTVPTGKTGYFLVTFNTNWQNSTGNHEAGIRKNGISYQTLATASGARGNIGYSIVLSLAAGDYIELYVYNYDTANVNVYGDSSGNNTTTFMAIAYLGA